MIECLSRQKLLALTKHPTGSLAPNNDSKDYPCSEADAGIHGPDEGPLTGSDHRKSGFKEEWTAWIHFPKDEVIHDVVDDVPGTHDPNEENKVTENASMIDEPKADQKTDRK